MGTLVLGTLVGLLTLLYAVILAEVAVVRLYRRFSGPIREKYTRQLLECLQPGDTLPSTRFPDTEYLFHRRRLIELLGELSPMLEGVEHRILRLIFYNNDLDRHILQECRWKNELRKTRALSVFVDVPMPDELTDELGRFRDSANLELRMVALLAWLNHDPEALFERLAEHPHPLSDRECANIYALARRRGVALEGAGELLRSGNPSVIRFGRNVLKLNEV